MNDAVREMVDKLARLYPKKAQHLETRILGGWSEVNSPQPWVNLPQPKPVNRLEDGDTGATSFVQHLECTTDRKSVV